MKKHFFSLIFSTIGSLLFCQSSSNLNLLGSLSFPGTECNDVWGYVSNTGKEYAIVGLQNGVSVVDVSDPTNPVESFFVAGVQSIWRDIKVWNNYAFVTADQGDDGLLIIDLEDLSGSTFLYTTFDANGVSMFSKAHNIFIDEFGRAYIFGGDVSGDGATAGALILDVTNVVLTPNDTVLPSILGIFDNFYLHDGMARGDTLWGAAIYEGKFFAIDVSDPTSPAIFNDSLAFQETPNEFTHNCWISDDGRTLFTTDEKSGAYIGSYDVSDLSNIQELDRVQSSPDIGTVIPHNAHVHGDYLITSYYRDGIVVHDISYPEHLVEVAHYDSYAGAGDGFDGSWGAYPYLPSGIILSSEINSGPSGEGLLVVLDPDYSPASYLKGLVKDSLNQLPLNNVSIRILSYDILSTSSNLSGNYLIGTGNQNTYEVEYSKLGYFTDTIEVTFSSGQLVTKNVALLPQQSFTKTGKVVNTMGEGIANSNVFISSSFFKDTTTTNNLGEFNLDTLYQADYTFNVGSWGYRTICDTYSIVNDSTSLTIVLDSSYYDDFTFDFGWQSSGNATSGFWELSDPNPTIEENQIYNPSDDISTDCSNRAYVTGNAIGGGSGGDDVDDGYVKLTSPIFDLADYTQPVIKYYQWFANGSGWSEADDSLNVYLSNGIETVLISSTVAQLNNQWQERNIVVSEYITPTSEMTFSVTVSDYAPNNHLVEGAIDGFEIYEDTTGLVDLITDNLVVENVIIFPNPANERIFVAKEGEKIIYNSSGLIMLTTSQKRINISHFQKGIYILNVGNHYQKFVKL